MSISFNEDDFKKRLDNLLYPTLPYRSLKKKYSIFRNTSKKICSKCGGKCCKNCGCHFSPDDFKEVSFEFLKKELEKGYISIDHVDGELISQSFGVFILRIRNQGAPIVDLGYKRTPCILLTEKGCKLKYKNRPSGGKLLIPSDKFRKDIFGCDTSTRNCQPHYTIKDCCYEWKPHQKILAELIEYFRDKEIPCSI